MMLMEHDSHLFGGGYIAFGVGCIFFVTLLYLNRDNLYFEGGSPQPFASQ